MNLRRWLTPGIGIKRWLLVVFAGLLLLAIAFAHFLRQITRDLEPTGIAGVLIEILTLQFLPFAWRGLVAGSVGLGLFLFGSYRVIHVLTDPLRAPDPEQPLVELIYQKRFLARGPRIVAIGGGTGLSTLLRGLKEHTSNLTAIVTVADDGGSSGVLRTELGIPPVGDIRNCVVALADAEPLMSEVMQYRFPATDGGEASGLAGHALGNLLIAGMTAVEGGDFEDGIRLMNRILAVRGQVLPVSPTPLTLHAQLADGTVVDGQSQIMGTAGIERVWITPGDVRASDDALAAIADAELIVLGPGSLYTSLLPSLLIPAIRDAVERATAPRIYVCNVAMQEGETAGFDLARHVEVLAAHTSPNLVDIVLANNHAATPGGGASLAGASGEVGPPALATGGGARTEADPRRRGGSGQRPPPRPGVARGGDHPGARRRDRDPSPHRGTLCRPDGLMTRTERDLVTALRDELAAIDPSRACDRLAEADALGPGPIGREASVARLAIRLRRLAEGRSPAGFTWPSAAEHCRTAWLRGRFLARGSLSLAGGRTHLEFVVDPVEAPELAGAAGRDRPARVVAAAPRTRRRDVQERRGRRARSCGASARPVRSSRSRRGRCRARSAASSTACSTPSRPISSAPSARPGASSTRSHCSTRMAGCRRSPTSSGWWPRPGGRRPRPA